MVVVSIIIILIAVSVPSYQQHVKMAREAALRENLYQMRMAIDRYALDKLRAPQSIDDLVTAGYLGKVPPRPLHQLARDLGSGARGLSAKLRPDSTRCQQRSQRIHSPGRRRQPVQLVVRFLAFTAEDQFCDESPKILRTLTPLPLKEAGLESFQITR
jgi:type II secretory pathway pseudopilin PulG